VPHIAQIVVHIARCTCIAGLTQGEALRFRENLGLSFNTWNYYTEDEGRKALLYRLDEAATIVSIYEKFKNIYADAPGYPHVRGKLLPPKSMTVSSKESSTEGCTKASPPGKRGQTWPSRSTASADPTAAT
jgi:hypothetical protein